MDTLLQDVRHSIRLLIKHRGFTAVAVVALALGIGANTAVFSVVDAALLRPLPFGDADRLVDVHEKMPREQFGEHEASYPDYLDWRRSGVFEDVAGYTGGSPVTLSGREAPERVRATFTTANFFDVLGVAPALGRSFRPGDDVEGGESVVMLSHGLWQRRFGGSPDAVGQTLEINGRPYTIVGVLPESFQFAKAGPVDVWGALVPPPFADRRNRYWINTVARLEADTSLDETRAAMRVQGERLSRDFPDSHLGVEIVLVPMRDALVGNVKPVLLALLGAVAFVMLIACSNVANLLLVRSAARRKEIAVRMALGAGRWRLARQFLTESVILGLIGGALGLLLGLWGRDLLVAAIPDSLVGFMPYLKDAGLDWATLGFTLAMAIATGLVFGLAPALQATRQEPIESLKEGGKASVAPMRSALRGALVVSEIALALVLLVGAGLMMRSFVGLVNVDPGFDSHNLLSVMVPLTGSRYSENDPVLTFHEQLRERLRALPGVEDVAAVDILPIGGGGGNTASFAVKGEPPAAAGERPEANVRTVTDNYFQVMRLPLLAGRTFTPRDTAGTPRVLVVNRTLATRAFPGQDPVGKMITFVFDSEQTPYEIVGVAGDEKVGNLDASTTPVIYFPHAQDGGRAMNLVVRSTSDPAGLMGAIRATVHDLDPTIALGRAAPMEEVIADSPPAFLRRYPAFLAGILAVVALVLALEGIYGVMSYSVSQRTHEIGVRVAMGAQRRNIYALVIGQGMVLALAGIGAGLVAAFGLTRFMANLLYGVEPTDPLTFGAVAALLGVVALVACYVPARRAASVDPVVALRYE